MADGLTPPVVLSIAPDLRIDDFVGRYRIVESLGEGGMARVYGLRHEDTGHRAALKVPKLGLDAEFRDRFLLEARAHLNLNGKRHIVSPLETGTLPEPDGRPYLIMQRVDGVTLEAFMRDPARAKEDPEVALARSIRFIIQVAMALEIAHRLKPPVVHRDLKPSNVYVANDDEMNIEGREVEYVLLGDFGLAWRRGDQVNAVGTPEYCSPEQAANEEPTTRSDFYSLGVMLFELIEGHLPFVNDDVLKLLAMHRSTPPPLLTNPYAEQFQPIVSRLLAKHWEARPGDAREIINLLTGALLRMERRDQVTAVKRVSGLGFPMSAPVTDRLPTVPPEALAAASKVEPSIEPPRRSPARFVIPPVVIAVGVGAWLLFRTPDEGAAVVPPADPTQTAVVVAPPPLPPVPPVEEPDARVEELTPLTKVPPRPIRPTPPKPSCEVTPLWQKSLQANLLELEERSKMDPLELGNEVKKLGREIDGAKPGADCSKINARFEALKRRALP